MERIHLKIRRQDSPEGLSYWEEFYLPYEPGMNVIRALERIRRDPVTADDLPTTPVVWEQSCLEEACGSCTMLINGTVRHACSAMVDDLSQPIVLEPMAKFPVIRDLHVDRASMEESLVDIRAWSEIDGLHEVGDTPTRSPEQAAQLYALSQCIMCGSCLDACPQVNDRSPYGGAFMVAQVLLMNERGAGSGLRDHRLNVMKGPGGIGGCSNAQNCESVCPKDIPLLTAIARIQWEVTKHAVATFFRG